MDGLIHIDVGPPSVVEIGNEKVGLYANADEYQELDNDNREEEIFYEEYGSINNENYNDNRCKLTCSLGTVCSFEIESATNWKEGQVQERSLQIVRNIQRD